MRKIKRFYGGEKVGKGVYLGLKKGEFITVEGEEGILPGGPAVEYVRTPMALAAIAGPIMGLAYVIFLPFVGFAAVAGFAGYQVVRGWKAAFRRQADVKTLSLAPEISPVERWKRAGGKVEEKAGKGPEEVVTK